MRLRKTIESLLKDNQIENAVTLADLREYQLHLGSGNGDNIYTNIKTTSIFNTNPRRTSPYCYTNLI